MAGLGVRDVKRLTKVTGIDESRLGLILEATAAAGLIAAGMPEPVLQDGAGPYWAPTVAADRFLEPPTAQQMAPAGVDVAGPSGPAEPGRDSGPGR